MRKPLLIIGTIVVLGIALAAFLSTQARVPMQVSRPIPNVATRPGDGSSQRSSIGRGQGAWVVTYDKKTVLPQMRFRADEYVPQEDGRWLVKRPQIEFFIGSRREKVIRIEGKTGTIIMSGEGLRIKGDLSSSPMQPPSRGEMRDVTISYFPDQQAVDRSKAQIVLDMNNAYFDNDTFEVATEQYTDADGKVIPAREVPVRVRGEAFDFDGKGLLVRWDDRAQKLKSLTVFKGDQLVLKKALREVAMGHPSQPVQLAATDKASVAQVAADTAAKMIYRATFFAGVIVRQTNEELATADQMQVDFSEPSSSDDSPVTVAPSPAAKPGARPSAKAAPSPARPATAEGDATLLGRKDPVVITWGGELTIKPAPDEPLRPANKDDAIVRFVASADHPVRLQSQKSRIEDAAWVAYQTSEQAAWLESSGGKPVRLTDAKGNSVQTPQLRYWEKRGLAVCRGPSVANVTAENGGKSEKLEARWQDVGEVHFADQSQKNGVESLVLQGGVQIKHPQIERFSAGRLVLEFAQAKDGGKAGTPPLKELRASDGVDGVFLNKDGGKRTIQANNLTLDMTNGADGQSYPSHFTAAGNARVSDGLQEIQADSLNASLSKQQKSATGINAELSGVDDLVAKGNVHLKSKAGETASGEELTVKQVEGKPAVVVLKGNSALLTKQSYLVSGRRIEVLAEDERVMLSGPGRLVMPARSAAAPGEVQTVEVTWTADAEVNGKTNQASLQGDVVAKFVGNDGASNEARGDRMDLVLDKSKKAVAGKETDRLAFLSDRVVKQVTLLPAAGKEIQVQSVLPGPNGTILRQISLLGPRLDAEMSEENGLERLLVPGAPGRPGRMLYVELPPATRKPTKVDDPLKTGKLPGATAFSWNDKLEYIRSSNQFVMLGNTIIRHDPRLPGAQAFAVDAQKITGDLEQSKDTSKRTASRPGEVTGVELKRLLVEGSPAHMVRGEEEMYAPQVEIWPATSQMVATGSATVPVEIVKGRYLGKFGEVQMNTQTQEIRVSEGQGTGRR